VAGASLKSVTCNPTDTNEGWALRLPLTSAPGLLIPSAVGNISPQDDPSLCVDVTSGVPQLEPCQGPIVSQYQQFVFSNGQISSNSAEYGRDCLNVMGESTADGQAIDLVPCKNSPAQLFWTWGMLTFVQVADAERGEPGLLTTVAFGQDETVTNNYGAEASPMSFTLNRAGLITQYNPRGGVDSAGQTYGMDQCLTVNGLDLSSSNVSIQPCERSRVATQQWHMEYIGEAMSIVSSLTGYRYGGYGGKVPIPTKECLQGDGTLEACSGQASQDWQVPGGLNQ